MKRTSVFLHGFTRVRIVLTILLLCAAQVFVGCSDILTEKPDSRAQDAAHGEKLYTVSGCVGGNGARNAQAALPTADRYTVTATNESGTETDVPIEENKNNTFSIRLPAGTYTFTAEGKKDGKIVLRGKYKNVTVPRTEPISISVSPISTESGTENSKGNINLKLTVSGCGIKSIKAVWREGGEEKTQVFDVENTDGSETAVFTVDDMPVGLYSVRFYFYNDTKENQASAVELYSCTESIYVFQNLTADTWQKDSGQPYITDDGTFTLTKAVINKYTMFYVDTNGNPDNEGTYFSPLDSIQTALERIERTNDGSTSFKIYLKTDIVSTDDAPYDAETNSAFVNITPALPLRLTIESYRGTVRTINAKRTATNTGRVMYIGGNAHVTLSNVNITGGNMTDNGGGIFIYNGKLTLSGVAITDCSATSTDASSIKGNGGGIYNYNGTLTVTGGEITSCTASTSGGGVFNNVTGSSVISTITNCTVTTCTAGGTVTGQGGGGIYNASGTLELSGVTITGGNDTANPDATYGGGIYNNTGATVTITDGAVSDCTATTFGGGIYNYNGTLTMGGAVSIPSATGAVKDNDFYLVSGKAITISSTLTAQSPVATIARSSYTAGLQVLQAADGYMLTAEDCGKFAVADSKYGVELKDGTGVLRLTQVYVSASGNDTNPGTATSPLKTFAAAAKKCTSGTNTIYIDGTTEETEMAQIAAGATVSVMQKPSGSTATIKAGAAFSGDSLIHVEGKLFMNGIAVDCDTKTSGFECVGASMLEITCGSVKNGTATEYGGGIYANQNTTTVKIKDCTISACKTTSTAESTGGGGIYNKGNLTIEGTLTVLSARIASCTAGRSGGGIYNSGGTITLSGVDFATCVANGASGGGLCSSGGGTVTGCQFRDCHANQYGGGIYKNGTKTLTVTGTTYDDACSAGTDGNGAYGL